MLQKGFLGITATDRWLAEAGLHACRGLEGSNLEEEREVLALGVLGHGPAQRRQLLDAQLAVVHAPQRVLHIITPTLSESFFLVQPGHAFFVAHPISKGHRPHSDPFQASMCMPIL